MLGFFCDYGKNVCHCKEIMMPVCLVAGPPLVLCWELGRTEVSPEVCTCQFECSSQSAMKHIVSLSVNE